MTATDTVLAVAVTLLGAIVGSFLNVVIHRLPQGTFFSDGHRSICAKCRAPIPWHANIPVLGWLWLRGVARCCGQKISVRYPLVEAVTAALFLALWVWPPFLPAFTGTEVNTQGVLSFLFFAFFAANLVANSAIDVDHRILPDVLTKSAMAVGLIGALVVPGLAGTFDILGLAPPPRSLLFSAVGLLAGFGLTQLVRVSARALFRKDAMGFGDVKLMAAIGAFLGWEGVLHTFFLGCVLGAVFGVIHRIRTRDAYICFGPFLSAGALISLFAGDRLMDALAAMQRWQQTSESAPWIVFGGGFVSIVLLVVLVRRGRAS